MRIVDWAEFSTLPPGTIYQQVSPYSLGDLSVVGKVLSHGGQPRDFVEENLLPSAMGSEYFGKGTFEHEGVTFPDGCPIVMWPSHSCRDGMYEFKRRWLIWDEADRKRLAGWLLDPSKVGDGPEVLLKIEEDRA